MKTAVQLVRQLTKAMVEIKNNNLVFAFPEVNSAAELSIHFRAADSSEKPVPILGQPDDDGYILQGQGALVMYLRPMIAFKEFWYGTGTKIIRFPFAILLTVGGQNALTGDQSRSLIRNPQNYFTTPPQGGIDAYRVGDRLLPLRSGDLSPRERIRLVITVFPIKKETWDHWMFRKRLCGWSHPVISELTLAHGGERQCEPVYEDLCCIGDWDQTRPMQASVWLGGGEVSSG